jgi:hypothetical protein
MERRTLSRDELSMVAGGNGFPDGELPEGVNLCLRCGSKEDLELINEVVVEDSGNPTIDGLLTDKTRRLYRCNVCNLTFWRYGLFYEIQTK